MGELRKSRIGKGQSAWREMIGKQRIKEDGLVEWERKGLVTMRETHEGHALPVKEDTNPMLTSNIRSAPSSQQRDSLTTELVTPTSPSTAGPLKTVRWSDATPRSTIKAIRHETQLLQPSPQTAPTWGWGASGVGKQEVEGIEEVKENLVDGGRVEEEEKKGYGNWNGNGNFGRPDSLGLYDSDGFLKSSPVEGA